MTIIAWHGDPGLKAEAVALMTRHREQDDFIRGTYTLLSPGAAAGYKGCFHGCLTTEKLAVEASITPAEFVKRNAYSGWHADGERIWGIDRRVGAVLDRCFESLPEGWADFAVASIEAIPVGADLGPALDAWLLDVLADDEHGVRQYTVEGSAQRIAVDVVVGLYRRRIGGDDPSDDEWRKAAYAAAAADAGADAAYAAAVVAADDAAYAAWADAAYDAAAYAAAAAADAAAYAAADADFWSWCAQRLLHQLGSAPVPATRGADHA